jgi:hypothetical protein
LKIEIATARPARPRYIHSAFVGDGVSDIFDFGIALARFTTMPLLPGYK